MPWKEHLYELEKEQGIEGQIKFCLYEVRFLEHPISICTYLRASRFYRAI